MEKTYRKLCKKTHEDKNRILSENKHKEKLMDKPQENNLEERCQSNDQILVGKFL